MKLIAGSLQPNAGMVKKSAAVSYFAQAELQYNQQAPDPGAAEVVTKIIDKIYTIE